MFPLDSVTAVIVAVVFLLTLILWCRMQAFLSLLLAAIFFALVVGMPVGDITQTVVDGMGSSLGLVSILIGLGAIFGIMLEHSGGAQAMAKKMISIFGEQRAPYALVVAGFLISIPVFLDVAWYDCNSS